MLSSRVHSVTALLTFVEVVAISTSFTETGVIFSAVVAVLDAGTNKNPRMVGGCIDFFIHPAFRVSGQRAGRTGRTCPGVALSLWDNRAYRVAAQICSDFNVCRLVLTQLRACHVLQLDHLQLGAVYSAAPTSPESIPLMIATSLVRRGLFTPVASVVLPTTPQAGQTLALQDVDDIRPTAQVQFGTLGAQWSERADL